MDTKPRWEVQEQKYKTIPGWRKQSPARDVDSRDVQAMSMTCLAKNNLCIKKSLIWDFITNITMTLIEAIVTGNGKSLQTTLSQSTIGCNKLHHINNQIPSSLSLHDPWNEWTLVLFHSEAHSWHRQHSGDKKFGKFGRFRATLDEGLEFLSVTRNSRPERTCFSKPR